MRAFLVHAALVAAAAAGLVWLAAGGLVQWQGMVSHRLPALPDAPVVGVVLAESEGSRVLWWPRWAAMSLDVPTDRSLTPPPGLRDGRPTARKDRFTLHFEVQEKGDTAAVRIPTTSPRVFGLGILAFGIGLALRNMWWSGAPWRIGARAAQLPVAQPRSGVPVRPDGPSKPPPSRPGPPPRHKRARPS